MLKIWDILGANVVPHVENSTLDLMWWITVKMHKIFIMLLKFPLGYTYRMYSRKRILPHLKMGPILKQSHLQICKYSKTKKNLKYEIL
jgi:hypothetical protein